MAYFSHSPSSSPFCALHLRGLKGRYLVSQPKVGESWSRLRGTGRSCPGARSPRRGNSAHSLVELVVASVAVLRLVLLREARIERRRLDLQWRVASGQQSGGYLEPDGQGGATVNHARRETDGDARVRTLISAEGADSSTAGSSTSTSAPTSTCVGEEKEAKVSSGGHNPSRASS